MVSIRIPLRLILALLVIVFGGKAVYAAASDVGRIVYVSGPAWIEQSGVRDDAKAGSKVFRSDVVVTGPRGRAKIQMRGGSRIYVSSNSRLALKDYVTGDEGLVSATFDMLWGKVRFLVSRISDRHGSFSVRSTTAVLGVRGTEFAVIAPVPLEIPDPLILENLPKAPMRIILFSGSLLVTTVSGQEFELLPGFTLHVDAKGGVEMRKTELGDGNPFNGDNQDDGGGESAPPVGDGGEPPVLPPTPAPADTNTDVTNGIQNLGATTDATLQFNFVAP